MDDVRRVISDLVHLLEAGQKEATDLVGIMHQLQSYLDGESKNIIQGGLDRLLSKVRLEAARITTGSVVVLISPEGRATIDKTYSGANSDPYLKRLKSQGFNILTLAEFSHFIQSLKSKMGEGNLVPIIEFLRANAKIETPRGYQDVSPASAAEQPREPSTSSRWKPSDFLPAPFPRPPLPRGLFKDRAPDE
jgi:hypothetical protein